VVVVIIRGPCLGLMARLVLSELFGPATSACSQTLEPEIFK